MLRCVMAFACPKPPNPPNDAKVITVHTGFNLFILSDPLLESPPRFTPSLVTLARHPRASLPAARAHLVGMDRQARLCRWPHQLW